MSISRNSDSVNIEKRPPRAYRMRRRAAAREETRERIVRATIALHDEQGVAATSFADIAARAGVGAATVLRHFPDVGSLVTACGAHVGAEMRPPRAEEAAAVFAGLDTAEARIGRLVAELDAFYARGAVRLRAARNDRHRIAELDGFLRAVEAGIAALIAEALADERPDAGTVAAVAALADFGVWARLRDAGTGAWEEVMPAVIAAAIDSRHHG
jgi:AcrR family transcriptional regulator